MKNLTDFLKFALTVVLLLSTAFSAMAYDYYVGGIYYNKLSSNAVEVTYKDTNYDSYTGAVTIPRTISYGGNTYTVTKIGAFAFKGNSDNGGHLTSVSIPTSVVTIEHDAFWLQKNLGNVTIPSSVTTIGNYAFCWCSSMTSATIPNTVTSLGKYVYSQCKKLSSVTIGTGITTIDEECFYGCEKLTTVTIPNNIKTVAKRAFKSCTTLSTVTIGSGVTSMGNEVFDGCTALTSVTCKAFTPPTITSNTFNSSHYSNVTLTVPVKSKSAYQAADYWKNFTKYASNNYDFSNGGIYYAITGANTVEVVGKNGSSGNSYSGSISIPTNVSYGGVNYSVTGIGDYAFKNSTGLTYLYIPSSITYLGNWAVSGCSALTSIVIPNSVTSVGTSVFMDCTNLTSVTIGSGLKKIGRFMFIRCTALESITIPNTVTEIDYEVFQDCTKLKNVDIGSGVTAIGNLTFAGCTALQYVICHAQTPPTVTNNTFDSSTYSSAYLYVPYSKLNNYKAANYWKNFTTIRTVYDFKVDGICYNKTSSNTVEVTSRGPLENRYTNGLTIPKTITVSGTTYTVNAIGEQAFLNCYDLTDVSLNVNIKTIGKFAFAGCTKMTNVFSVPSGLTSIDYSAFLKCYALKSFNLPNNLKTIGNKAFEECIAFTSVNIPNSVTSLGYNAYAFCTALNTVKIGTGVTSLATQTFKGCTALTSIVVPDNITSISDCVFEGCTSLAEVTLGSGLMALATTPFKGCTALRTVTCLASNPPTMAGNDCFPTATYSSGTLNVPGASVNAYKSADWWRLFNTVNGLSFDFYVNGIYYKKTSSNTVEVTYKDIMNNVYTGTVNIPSSIKVGSVTYKVVGIGEYAFYMCSGLTKVTMPTSILRIGGCGFEKCTGLTSVEIPNSVTKLEVDAFASCTGLKSIEIPSSVTTIGSLAFYKCTAMTSATIGSGVTTIEAQAFASCTSLNSVTCLANTPPVMKNKNCFDTNTYNTAKLYVPQRALNAYKSADWWRMFSSIIGGDFGGDPCDVNGDGEVNISDVNAIIDAILRGNSDLKYDANGDGEVNIADVNTIIDTILKS